MEPATETEELRYVIPARTISGSAQDILDELDDMMDALRLVREAVVEMTPKPARPRHDGWAARAWRAIAGGNGHHPASSAKR